MRGLLALIILAALVGCNQDGTHLFPKWFFSESTETEEGLIIYELSGDLPYSDELHDRWWIETQQCLQMEASSPIVLYVDNLSSVCHDPDMQRSSIAVHCDNNDDAIGWFIAVLSTADWTDMAYYRQHLKHEFTHYIREETGDTLHIEHRGNDPLWQCQYN